MSWQTWVPAWAQSRPSGSWTCQHSVGCLGKPIRGFSLQVDQYTPPALGHLRLHLPLPSYSTSQGSGSSAPVLQSQGYTGGRLPALVELVYSAPPEEQGTFTSTSWTHPCHRSAMSGFSIPTHAFSSFKCEYYSIHVVGSGIFSCAC